MLVLLSSGASRRYRDDIIRVLALPEGADLQFRYDRRYIDEALAQQIGTGQLKHENAIVLYLWSDKENLRTETVPCRFVTVVGTEFSGSTCIIRLRVGSFVAGLDDAKLRSALSPEEISFLPHWETSSGTAPKLVGKFFFAIQSALQQHVTDDLSSFETVAAALGRYSDFAAAQSTVFYTVRRLVKFCNMSIGSSAPHDILHTADGSYKLSSGERYELEVYCFFPPSAKERTATLHISSDVEAVKFPLGKDRAINSRYDLKRFPFTVEQRTVSLSAGLRLYLTEPEAVDKAFADVILPVVFAGSLLFTLVRIIVIGLGASMPAMIAANSAGKLNLSVALVMFLAGLVAGAGTVFTSLKKP